MAHYDAGWWAHPRHQQSRDAAPIFEPSEHSLDTAASFVTAFLRDLRPGMQGFVPLSTRVSRNQSASYPPTLEDYESPQCDKLNQSMGPDPNYACRDWFAFV
jgi:hypothetical protein